MADIKDINSLGEDQKFDNIVYLNDAEGNRIEFEFLGQVSYKNENYVILIPTADENEDQVTILKLESTNGLNQENYVSVNDPDVLDAVFKLFMEKYKDTFDFV